MAQKQYGKYVNKKGWLVLGLSLLILGLGTKDNVVFAILLVLSYNTGLPSVA